MTDLATRPTARPCVVDADVNASPEPDRGERWPTIPVLVIAQSTVALFIGCIGRFKGWW